MNIYALKGHKVRLKTDINMNAEHITENCRRYLERDVEYTVEETIVNNSTSTVRLQSIPNTSFNTVFFEDVSIQNKEQDQKHPDWLKYRGFSLIRTHFKNIDIHSILGELGYNRSEIPHKLTSWYIEKEAIKIEKEVKEFESLVLKYLSDAKSELGIFVEKSLKKDARENEI